MRAYQAETVLTPDTSLDNWIARSECKCLHERDQVRITNVCFWPFSACQDIVFLVD